MEVRVRKTDPEKERLDKLAKEVRSGAIYFTLTRSIGSSYGNSTFDTGSSCRYDLDFYLIKNGKYSHFKNYNSHGHSNRSLNLGGSNEVRTAGNCSDKLKSVIERLPKCKKGKWKF